MRLSIVSQHAFLVVVCAQQSGLASSLDSVPPKKDFPNNKKLKRFTQETSTCDICAFNGSSVRDGVIPSRTSAATRLWFSEARDDLLTSIKDDSITCSEWSNLAMNTTELAADSTDCFDLRDWLSWQCCGNMPSLSECEATAKQMILTDDTPVTQTVVPITQGATLDVKVSAYVSDVSIVNYGVDGGAVEVTGSLMLSWVDARLRMFFHCSHRG